MLYYFAKDANGDEISENLLTGEKKVIFTRKKDKYLLTGFYKDCQISIDESVMKENMVVFHYTDQSYSNYSVDYMLINPDKVYDWILYYDGNYLYVVLEYDEPRSEIVKFDVINNNVVTRQSMDGESPICFFTTESTCYINTSMFNENTRKFYNQKLWAYNMESGKITLIKKFSGFSATTDNYLNGLEIAGGYLWGFGTKEKLLGWADEDLRDSLDYSKCCFHLPLETGN